MKIKVGIGGAIVALEIEDITDAAEIKDIALEAGLTDNEAMEVIDLIDAGDFLTE